MNKSRAVFVVSTPSIITGWAVDVVRIVVCGTRMLQDSTNHMAIFIPSTDPTLHLCEEKNCSLKSQLSSSHERINCRDRPIFPFMFSLRYKCPHLQTSQMPHLFMTELRIDTSNIPKFEALSPNADRSVFESVVIYELHIQFVTGRL